MLRNNKIILRLWDYIFPVIFQEQSLRKTASSPDLQPDHVINAPSARDLLNLPALDTNTGGQGHLSAPGTVSAPVSPPIVAKVQQMGKCNTLK